MSRRKAATFAALVVIALRAAGYGAVRVISARQRDSPKGAATVAQPRQSEGSISVHGRDRSTADSGGTALVTCDLEADGNPVKGVYDFDVATSGGDGAIEDPDGSGGPCASIETQRKILRHRTCERNHVALGLRQLGRRSGTLTAPASFT